MVQNRAIFTMVD